MGKARQNFMQSFQNHVGSVCERQTRNLLQPCAAPGGNPPMPTTPGLTRAAAPRSHVIPNSWSFGPWEIRVYSQTSPSGQNRRVLFAVWAGFRVINMSLREKTSTLREGSAELGVCLVLCSPASTGQEAAFQWGQLFGEALSCSVAAAWPFKASVKQAAYTVN